ncbi:hypothetical protein CHS0354_018104 [Potamilus streckersoni]|uniref:C1q domain-containing protein n=1 Tax=Potamilus streckersoni TaxID=2493646 RepID=A0AAE0TL51_9BIVA|nr:hypothetical protein CHS0354_018104 [Potamilus streckersoni]
MSRPVAFSAYITHFTSHLGIDQIIRYDGVLTNEGNAYNPLTGVFTCPKDGLYLLAFFTATVNDGFSWVKLVVDGITVSNAVSNGVRVGNDDQGGNVALIRLTAGQSVWTATFFKPDIELDSTSDFRHVTFSSVCLSD